jgi:hypothetical protein
MAEFNLQIQLNSVPYEIYCLICLFVYSLAPRSHEWYGLQKLKIYFEFLCKFLVLSKLF